MKHFGTFVWLTILVVSVGAIGAGFAGGQSIQRAAAAVAPLANEPLPDVALPPVRRALYGARGDEVSFDPVEPRVEEAVVSRPLSVDPGGVPAPRAEVQLAIVILGMGEDRTLDGQFQSIPYALTFALAADDEPPAQPLRTDPRGLVVDLSGTTSEAKAASALAQFGAGGVISAVAGDPSDAKAVVALASSKGAFVIDGMAGDSSAVYRRARHLRVPAATRDVVIDAFEEEPYTAYMIRQAGRLARRTGFAIAVGHAYPETYEALRRTLPLLAADDITVVPAGELVR